MKIVADENIPLIHKFFDDIGTVETYPGRTLSSQQLTDADVLLVRSVTQVDEALLAGSNIKFVGTCTIGYDHIDLNYLKRNNIIFASAPGCNAVSVVEYILSCLSVLTETKNIKLNVITVGVVGCGNVGGRLAAKLKKLGIRTHCYDPLIDQEGMSTFEDILSCDLISLHTPLTSEGRYPTLKMFDASVLSKLSDKQVLINTGRGAVIDGAALKEKLKNEPNFTAILDVWENEPGIDPELAKLVTIGTPHIAGYSLDGKISGTEMIYKALCRNLGLPLRHKAAQFMPEPPLSKLTFSSQAHVSDSMHTAIRACYDVRYDHSQLITSLNAYEEQRRLAFDQLRKSYRARREFSTVKVSLKNADSTMYSMFRDLGFNVKTL